MHCGTRRSRCQCAQPVRGTAGVAPAFMGGEALRPAHLYLAQPRSASAGIPGSHCSACPGTFARRTRCCIYPLLYYVMAVVRRFYSPPGQAASTRSKVTEVAVACRAGVPGGAPHAWCMHSLALNACARPCCEQHRRNALQGAAPCSIACCMQPMQL